MKAGIVTFHRAQNLGAVLQAYALCKYMNGNICETELIDYYPNNSITNKTYGLHRAMHAIKAMLLYSKEKNKKLKANKFAEFAKDYRLSQKKYYGDAEILANPPAYDVLISGSDQILNTTLTGNSTAFYLAFATDTKRISYASSFGRSEVTDAEKSLIRTYLPQFSSLSVREAGGADIIEKEIGIKPQLVVDPVFLLSREEWAAMATPRKDEKQYVLVYAMEDTPQLRKGIEIARRQFQTLPLKVILGGRFKFDIDGAIDEACGPKEFLSYILNAECVVTNSFHGSAFSIIFEKQFICVSHSQRNARLENLANIIGSKDRLINAEYYEELGSGCIDGSKAVQAMRGLIEASKQYLAQNIGAKARNNVCASQASKDCCGCEACKQACPTHAILMKSDELGFLYPEVDETKCAQCGKCRRICPMKHSICNATPTQGYAVRHKSAETVCNSTSGGAFTALSDYVLQQGGVVVGAVFTENFQCRHILAVGEADRNRMRGTKYVQSRIGNCYQQTCEQLRQGKIVLFTGTPCQIAGLKNFLKPEDQRQLITVDIVCHGVPSPRILEEHIRWLEEKNGKVADYAFRSKDVGWHGHNVKITWHSGKEETNTNTSNAFARLYFNSLITRESCFSCPFSSMDRVGDITIGDFWAIDACDSQLKDNKGTSCVYVNNEKGKRYFGAVQKELCVEGYPLEQTMQPNLLHASVPSSDAELFRKDWKRKGFEYCVRKYTRGHLLFSVRLQYKRICRLATRLKKAIEKI